MKKWLLWKHFRADGEFSATVGTMDGQSPADNGLWVFHIFFVPSSSSYSSSSYSSLAFQFRNVIIGFDRRVNHSAWYFSSTWTNVAIPVINSWCFFFFLCVGNLFTFYLFLNFINFFRWLFNTRQCQRDWIALTDE